MAIRDLRSTRTYVVLEVPEEVFTFIHLALGQAKYDHAFLEDPEHGVVIDMHGIAIAKQAGTTLVSEPASEPASEPVEKKE